MTVWHYYEQATGMLTGRCITCDRAFAEANAATGHAVITGVRDWRTQRVDLATGDLVLHRPADDEWQRWVPGSDGGFVSEPTPAAIARAARRDRDRRLAACDWTQLPDVPASTAAAWATYRQALRDITGQPGWPTDITWPVPPA